MGDQQKVEVVLGVPRERMIIDEEGHYIKKIDQPYKIGNATHTILIDKEGSTKESIIKAVIEDAQRIKDLTGLKLQI